MLREQVSSETLTSAHWFPCPGRWPWWCRHDLPKYSSEVQEVPEEEKPVLMPLPWSDWAETMHTPGAHTRPDTHIHTWQWCQPREHNFSVPTFTSIPSVAPHNRGDGTATSHSPIFFPKWRNEVRIIKWLTINSRGRSPAPISDSHPPEITI